MSGPAFTLRAAEPRDVEAIVGLIEALAAFEKLEHLLRVSPAKLAPQLFGPAPAAEALVAEVDATVVGFALFFRNFSTFLAEPGLYLEDLFVDPAMRAAGVGAQLIDWLLAETRAQGWSRLYWNTKENN